MRGTWIRQLWLSCLLLLSFSGSVLAQTGVVVSPATLPDGAVGTTYGEVITASGTTGPYTFSVGAGTLPSGLTLTPGGLLSGAPDTVGTYSFTIVAQDGGSSGSRAYTVEIFPQATIEPPTLATAQVGVPYEQALTVQNGGAPSYTFGVSSGALPAGLTLASNGLISGTPTAAGDAGFTVSAIPNLIVATEFAPTAAPVVSLSRAYTLSVVPEPILLSPVFLSDASVGMAYSQAFSASGGTGPYVFTVDTGLPPGLTLASNGQMSGTPTVAGDYAFVVHATDALGEVGGLAYDLAVNPAPVVLSPVGPPNGTVGVGYDQVITASGGSPPYAFFAETSPPPGLVLEEDGRLHGVPTTEGSYDFMVVVYDSTESSDIRTYTIQIVGAWPVVSADEATTPSQQPVTIAVTANDIGEIDAIELLSSPAHGTATVSGLDVVYQPTGTFVGDDSFNYQAIGPGGFSEPATVLIHVTPLDPPAGVPQAVTTQPGVAVTIHAAAGATGGPITAVGIVQAPPSGSLEVSGTDVAYTPPDDAIAGEVIPVVYTLSNAYGTSAPVTSTVTIEAGEEPPPPLPEAMALEATTEMGVAVSVELTSGAAGGPFIAAEVISLSPQDAGTTTVTPSEGGYRLTFMPSAGFTGVAVAGFTLSNAAATSEPATLTITVTERPDPSDDPEVGGLTGAQVQIVRSFSNAQILNVINRLELLHEPGKPLSFWIGGSIRKGDSPGREFETSGMTGGMDYRFSDKFAFGGGLGYGRDRSMTGDNGSRADARAKSGMGYASYRPSLPWFIDMVSGYQRITFQLRRFVTGTGDMLEAPRDGTQAFSSWSGGYEKKGDKWMFSTYGRMDVAEADLDEYSENGDPLYALTFGEQSIQTRTRTLGVRGKYKRTIPWGTLEPRFRVELQRDFHDESGAAIAYSDLQSGPVYVLPGDALDSSRYIIEIGTIFKSKWGFVMRLDYRGVRGGVYDDDNAIMFSFQDDH